MWNEGLILGNQIKDSISAMGVSYSIKAMRASVGLPEPRIALCIRFFFFVIGQTQLFVINGTQVVHVDPILNKRWQHPFNWEDRFLTRENN